jgi:RimJ/RimL family protein N-acetyltransferase
VTAPWPNLSTRLEGRIVVLEPLGPSHADGLWAVAQTAEIWDWMPARIGGERADFDAWMDWSLEELATGASAPFAVLSAQTGEPVGSTRYMSLRPEHRGLEIGYTWMAPSTWGTGANPEAKLLLLAHAFDTLGCMRVEFKTDAKNESSRRALEALPARFEGIFVKHMLVRDGELRDSAWYAITDDEWPAVREALQARVDAKAGAASPRT